MSSVARGMQSKASYSRYELPTAQADGLALPIDGDALVLSRAKAFCSGAGHATRALVTAATPTGIQMLIVSVERGRRVEPSHIKLTRMRAAGTGSMDLTGVRVAPDPLLGIKGDYLTEPVFYAGAWRSSATALGALTALVDIHRQELLRRGRAQDPNQAARFGQLVIAYETARLWMGQAAARGCLEDDTSEAVGAYINLSRLAVKSVCLDAVRLTHRSLALSAFIVGHPAERIFRDLATYLRQPAPGEALAKAAAFYFQARLLGVR